MLLKLQLFMNLTWLIYLTLFAQTNRVDTRGGAPRRSAIGPRSPVRWPVDPRPISSILLPSCYQSASGRSPDPLCPDTIFPARKPLPGPDAPKKNARDLQ